MSCSGRTRHFDHTIPSFNLSYDPTLTSCGKWRQHDGTSIREEMSRKLFVSNLTCRSTSTSSAGLGSTADDSGYWPPIDQRQPRATLPSFSRQCLCRSRAMLWARGRPETSSLYGVNTSLLQDSLFAASSDELMPSRDSCHAIYPGLAKIHRPGPNGCTRDCPRPPRRLPVAAA